MQKCQDDCHAICDFCKYFPRGNSDPGYCSLLKKEVSRTFMCDDFCCFNVKINSDFTKLLVGLEGKWIVLSNDLFTILYVAEDLDSLTLQQINEGVVMRVPQSGSVYI